MCEYKAPQFFIKGGGSGFSDRQRDVFDQLIVTEKETTERQRENKCVIMKNDEEDILMEVDTTRPPRRQCKKFRGKESIFKVPDVPPLFKPTTMPDFKRNPHRWVRYSLGDVSQDDMSEQTNRAAALSFLRELDERKKKEDENVEEMDGNKKKPIVFKNPKRVFKTPVEKAKSDAEEDTRPHFISSKLIMPEYVVGEKRPKKRPRGEVKTGTSDDGVAKSPCSTIKLGHLVEDDEFE